MGMSGDFALAIAEGAPASAWNGIVWRARGKIEPA